MSNRIKLAFVGGGSSKWCPGILKDIMLIKELEHIDFYLLDKNLDSAVKIKKLGEKMNGDLQTDHKFIATDQEELSFDGCDFVIICISTGGLETMKHDLAVPEKYGIYATVGDTTGPGGWSRNLRNVPVFNDLADKIAKGSNHAVVLNYTNPMACLTKALCVKTKLRTVGLCHGLFENYEILQKIFGLNSEKQLNLRFGGVNHFFWMLDFKVNGHDGYAMLKEKLGQNQSVADLIKGAHQDEKGFGTIKYLTSELFETYGYLPYFGDRHTCEFLPHVITGNEKTLNRYQIPRTTTIERQEEFLKREEEVDRWISGEDPIDYTRSRETAADIIEAVALNKEFIDIINVPNVGQISSLPLGGIVETLGVINSLGFTPIAAGPLPDSLNRLVLPHVENSEMIYKAASEGNKDLALEALYNDPSCSHLNYGDIRKMAEELMSANKAYLPQF